MNKNFKEIKNMEKNTGFSDIEVERVFSSVANVYDLMNDAASIGVHRLWKRRFAQEFICARSSPILDVAGGTGDLAFYLRKLNPDFNLVICDFGEDMIRKGRSRIINSGMIDRIFWIRGDGQNLPFMSESFDYYSISFGIRNMRDPDLAMREAFRVLKSKGKYVCMEFAEPINPIFNLIYSKYRDYVIPLMGRLIANDSDSYSYLASSIRSFPKQNSFLEKMEEVGFERISNINLSGGIASIYIGFKS